MIRSRLLPWILAGLALTACTSTEEQGIFGLSSELNKTTSAVLYDPNVKIPKSGTFNWLNDSLPIPFETRIDINKLSTMLQDSIRGVMERKKFNLAQSNRTDLLVGYYAVVENDMTDSDLSAYYGIDFAWPSAKDETQKYPKGMIIIDIIDVRTRKPFYRTALQANVDFSLSDDIRKQRIDMAVNQLLAGFPPD